MAERDIFLKARIGVAATEEVEARCRRPVVEAMVTLRLLVKNMVDMMVKRFVKTGEDL